MIPILADRFDPEHAFLGKNAYVCVKFSRFNGIGLRHNGSYDPDIIIFLHYCLHQDDDEEPIQESGSGIFTDKEIADRVGLRFGGIR